MDYIMNFGHLVSAEKVTAAFTVVIALTGVFALGFAWKQIRESRQQTQVQHLLDFSRDFSNEPMVSFRQIAATKWLSRRDEFSSEMVELVNFFEAIGLLVRRRYLNVDDTWEMFSYTVFPLYVTTKSSIESEQQDDPNSFTNFVYLYERLSAVERGHRGHSNLPSDDALRDYWLDEKVVRKGTPVRRRRKRMAKAKGADAASGGGSSADEA